MRIRVFYIELFSSVRQWPNFGNYWTRELKACFGWSRALVGTLGALSSVGLLCWAESVVRCTHLSVPYLYLLVGAVDQRLDLRGWNPVHHTHQGYVLHGVTHSDRDPILEEPHLRHPLDDLDLDRIHLRSSIRKWPHPRGKKNKNFTYLSCHANNSKLSKNFTE